jgi:hypothetical protein
MLQISENVWVDPRAVDLIEWIPAAPEGSKKGMPRVTVNGTSRRAEFYAGKRGKQMRRLVVDLYRPQQ